MEIKVVSQENQNTTLKWLENPKVIGKIKIDDEIKNTINPVRGIYGIFIRDTCVYVGRSKSMYDRFLVGKGHLASLKKSLSTGVQNEKKSLQITLLKAFEQEELISIKILERVPLQFDNYNKDMQRLASAENKYVDYYQNIDQCLNQLPDGNNMSKIEWAGLS